MPSPGGPTTVLRRLLARDDAPPRAAARAARAGNAPLEVADDEEATAIAAGVLRRCIGAAARASVSLALGAGRALGGDDPGRLGRDRRPYPRRSSSSRSTPAALLGDGRRLGRAPPGLPRRQRPVLRRATTGSRSTRSRSSATPPSTRPRCCATGAGSSAARRRRRIRRRLDLLVEMTGLDRERMRLWGVVHALAWGVSGTKVEQDMVRCAELARRGLVIGNWRRREADRPSRIARWAGTTGFATAARSSRRSTRPTSAGSASRSTSCSRPAAGSSTSTAATATSSRR